MMKTMTECEKCEHFSRSIICMLNNTAQFNTYKLIKLWQSSKLRVILTKCILKKYKQYRAKIYKLGESKGYMCK